MKKVGNISQLVDVCEFEYASGRAKGVKAYRVNNGRICFTVLADQGLDILDLNHRGDNISFISKNGVVNRNGIGAFENYFPAGFLYTCGLDNISSREGYYMHGRFHHTPAEEICVIRDGLKVRITGKIYDTALFKQNLCLSRVIETEYGSDKLTVTDTLCNIAEREESYVLLYHVNLGYPMLDEGAEIKADVESTEGVTEHAARYIDSALKMIAPQDNLEELVYYHTLKNKDAAVKVINKKLKKEFTLGFDREKLPYFVEWKSMASGDYALGLEPTVSQFFDRKKYMTLAPHEKREYKLTFEIKDI